MANRTGRTKTFYVREAISQHLDELEDLYLAEKAPDNIRAARSKAILLDDVLKRSTAWDADLA